MKNAFFAYVATLALFASPAWSVTIRVSHTQPADFQTVQAAIDALPPEGGDILIAPGTYREKIRITKSGVHIAGAGKRAEDTVLVYGDGAINVGGTFHSATLDVSGDDFQLDNLTVQNDYWLTPSNAPSQAVAVSLTGDRHVLTRVRFLGHQDTLFSNRGPKGRMARHYFEDCYIEGHVDFIFGDSKAYFRNCEIHGVAHQSVMYTAQSRKSSSDDSAYVFEGCTLTADPKATNIPLGRAWRPYAAVIFIHTDIQAPIMKGGWSEWAPGKTNTLPYAYFAEYMSKGPGADPTGREPYSYQLTDKQAQAYTLNSFYKGDIAWLPESAQKAASTTRHEHRKGKSR